MNLSLRTKYLIYLVLVHLALVGLAWLVLRENKPWFIASEGFILLSVFAAVYIYRAFRQPSEFITAGIEAIKDKDFTIKFVPTGNREVDGLIDVYNLMIDQLRQERTKQAEQRLFLDKLIEAAPIAMLILDYDGRIAESNPKAVSLLRRSAETLVGKSLDGLDHPLLNQLTELPLGDAVTLKTDGVETYRVLQGQFIDRGFRRQFLMIEEMTAEIIETEKKAYGKVIRMMAHEVNNSIGAINSILAITEPEVAALELRQALRVAIERNDRLNRFMNRFADVVRLPLPNRTTSDLTTLTRDVVRLMQPQAAARGVGLQLLDSAVAVPLPVDVGQMEQVLVNLIKNALEACESGQRVELSITPHQLSIRDNGAPISDAVAASLFQPFFSTRPNGQGIGLTLSREILLNHGFAFSLRTEPDGWTVFTIRWLQTEK